MAVFGAPLAHGNDPERAVRAALEIRAALPGLSRELGHDIGAHIGIASGQVVASGGAGHRSYSITGDSVNLASRLTAAAAPGLILIADGVRAMLGQRLECRQPGMLAVKGFAEPVQAQLDRQRGRPFVGRRAELGQGTVSHNHLWFYCYAMQAALAAGEYDDAERYAAALEDYTRPGPFPWAEFFIAYGRVLARHCSGRRNPATLRELRRLDGQARRVGLRMALPAL
jgi:hypothetical protein